MRKGVERASGSVAKKGYQSFQPRGDWDTATSFCRRHGLSLVQRCLSLALSHPPPTMSLHPREVSVSGCQR